MKNDKLRGKIIEVYGSQRNFANAIGLSEVSVSLKLNNTRCWKDKEMEKIIELLNIDDEDIKYYFF